MRDQVGRPDTHQYPSNRGRASFREAVAGSSGEGLATALAVLRRKHGAEIAGQQLRRVRLRSPRTIRGPICCG